ncbi:hypothetical protein VDG1235_550 [Verrucomicrobiia bacterium DG1235]|nr:hypothetical protein VDG1235_550 [Verrucomicrobiae bacterium DG1235]
MAKAETAVYLATLGHPVTSLDSSSVGLQKAHQLAKENKASIETLCCDIADFAFPIQAYTGIVSIFCHLPPELRRSTYAQVAQSLRPGGVFILEAYTPAQLKHRTGGPPTPELLVTIEQLRQELTGLDITLAREIERNIHEGSLHTGRGSVAQLIAHKS